MALKFLKSKWLFLHDVTQSEETTENPHSAANVNGTLDNVRIWQIVAFTIILISILRGIRFPGMWSYSHYLFNYGEGFVKRGLGGTIAKEFHNEWILSYNFFLTISLLFLLVNVTLLIIIIRNLIRSKCHIIVGCVLVYSSSLAPVFLAHCIGYFDHLGLLIALIVILVRGFYKKLLISTVAMPIGLLVHEALFILFFPFIFMSLVYSMNQNCRKQLVLIFAFTILNAFVTFILSNAVLDQQRVIKMYYDLQSVVGLPLSRDAFDVLIRDSRQNIQIMLTEWSNAKTIVKLVYSMAMTFPAAILIIVCTIVLMLKSNLHPTLIVLTVLASCSPLLLHFAGWDMHRWNTLFITTSFLALVNFYNNYSDRIKPLTRVSSFYYAIFALLIFFNGASSIKLFDNYEIQNLPLIKLQKYVHGVLLGKEHFPKIPAQ